jgi:hypothetical protein
VQGSSSLAATLTTTAPGDLLVAFVGTDGPSGSTQTATVSGGGLTWTLVGRTDVQFGTAEVWSARATATLSGAAITSKLGKSGYLEALTVIASKSASGTGAVTKAHAASGVPSAA